MAWADLRQVPDLTFSEMKFLQKQQSSEHEQAQQPKSRKRDRVPVSNEEFSAYFTSNRPILAEMSTNLPANTPMSGPKGRATSGTAQHRVHPDAADPVHNLVNLAEAPMFRFDSAVVPRSRGSHLTWSVSEPARLPRTPAEQYRRSSTAASLPRQVRGFAKEEALFGPSAQNDTSGETEEFLRTVQRQSLKHLAPMKVVCEYESRDKTASEDVEEHPDTEGLEQPATGYTLAHDYDSSSKDRPAQPNNLEADQDNMREADQSLPHQGRTLPNEPRSSLPVSPTSIARCNSPAANRIPERGVPSRARGAPLESVASRGAFAYLSKQRLTGCYVTFQTASPTYMGQRLDEAEADFTQLNNYADDLVIYNETFLNGGLHSGENWASDGVEHVGDDAGLNDKLHDTGEDDKCNHARQDEMDEDVFEGFWQPNILYS